MSHWRNNYKDNAAHFCTAVIHRRRPAFSEGLMPIVYEEWNEARADLEIRVIAYVLMPDHFHIMVWAETGQDVLCFLQQTASRSARRFDSQGRLWNERPRVLPVYSSVVVQAKIDYIHRNPLRRGLVEDPADWPHSSYRQLVCGAQDVPFRVDEAGDLLG